MEHTVVGFHEAIAKLMEDRRDGVSESGDPAALARLLPRFREGISAAEGGLLVAFARSLFGKADPLLLEAFEPVVLEGLTRSAYRFVLDRRREPLAVRVFRPEKGRDGWDSPNTVVETILDDHPFIVDTVCETLRQQGADIRLLLHPLLGVRRTPDGSVERIGPPDRVPVRESFLHVEAADLAPARSLEVLLGERLRQLLLVTGDYGAMKSRVAFLAEMVRKRALPPPWGEDTAEAGALLDWLGEKNFVYLGVREYAIQADASTRSVVLRRGSGLGLFRDEARSRFVDPQPLDPALERRLQGGPLLMVSKTSAASPVHRLVPMDDLILLDVDESGRVRGAHRLLGLFTSKGYSEAAGEVPLLRKTLAALLELEGGAEDSHDYKDLVSLFNSISKDELFASRPADIRQLLRDIGRAQPGTGMRLLCRPDGWGRGVLAVVLVPRSRFSTELHGRVTALLRRHFGATILSDHLALDERPQVRLHYYVAAPPDSLEPSAVHALEQKLDELLWTWDDELRAELARLYPRAVVQRLIETYGNAFSPAYKADTAVAEALRDIGRVEALLESGDAQIEFAAQASEAGTSGRQVILKAYSWREALALSDFMPVLENLGLRVFGEDFVDLVPADRGPVRVRTFFVQASGSPEMDVVAAGPRLTAALRALRAGEVENDRLNALILRAGLEWQQADVLRAYVEHARQAGVGSRETLIEAIAAHPESARCLFSFFAARFDPDAGPADAAGRAEGLAGEAERNFLASLASVDSLVHDGLFRTLGATVAATVRTNFYSRSGQGSEGRALAFKLDAARLAHLPQPRPMFETYVHSAHVEGVHLRAGRVARGGIRLSDRPDEFRAEVLGLMKTQVVKNAVIVPVGAKGGFVVKGRGGGTPASAAERAYRTLVEALLCLTDNIEDGRVVSPAGMVVYDEGDPYLVVAADKGTATFSDIANEIALRRGFWLGDAFASGGRHGYDHKKLGITARGAWECARQHFREFGRDIDHEPVSVIGIGDMSGDVFGNGLLRSRTIRLRAAFNHHSVFLDPCPDPEESFRERERLFRLPASEWTDYDSSRLSAGGGVFSRSAKSVPLSVEARAMLGTDATTVSGEDLVRLVLRMEADLLWNGGVGTYVRASDESDNEVGDPANDRVRIVAKDLRVLVVAEGGNLGFTQRARIEFALGGGRINTDAIDNSAGVDCSDHEVNLKVAFGPPVAAGKISAERRNALLVEVADEVCEAVLERNRRQAFALGLDQLRSRTQLSGFRDLITTLEAEAGLDRQLHDLPSREMLRARRSIYLGLTRPELSVLLAFTKLDLQRRLLASSLCDDAIAEPYLEGYFPEAVRRDFAELLREHPLRREIAAAELANRLVDVMGVTFLSRLATDTGRDIAEVATAWTGAVAIAGGEDVLRRLMAGRFALSPEAELSCSRLFERALERTTKWMIETQSLTRPLADVVEDFREPVGGLLATWPEVLPEPLRESYRAEVEELVGAGVETELAERLVRLAALEDALEICHLARESEAACVVVAEAYFQSAALVDLEWVRRTLPASLAGEDRWERRAVGGLLEGLMYARRGLTRSVLDCRRDGASVDECVNAYSEEHRAQLERLTALIDDLKAGPAPGLPAMLVVMRELGRLAHL